MSKKNINSVELVNFFVWLVSLLVSISVGYSLIIKRLTIPFIEKIPYAVEIAGLLIIGVTLLAIIIKIFDYLY